jgi:hypothetical protein
MAIVSVTREAAASARRSPGESGTRVVELMKEIANTVGTGGHGTDDGGGGPPAAQASTKTPGSFWPAVSLIGVVAAAVLFGLLLKDAKYSQTTVAVAGLSVFAGLYAAAQGLERFLEPISHWFLSTVSDENDYSTAVSAADDAVAAWAATPTPASKTEAEDKMNAMAKAKGKVDGRRDDRAAAYWGIASIAGMAVSGYFHVYLLRLVGVATTHGWDLAATGIIIGSGTKPLHDLITNLSSGGASSDAASGGSTTVVTST